MKRKFSDIVVETMIGLILTLGLESIISVIKAKKKVKNIDSTFVCDLTVGELKEILKKEETCEELPIIEVGEA